MDIINIDGSDKDRKYPRRVNVSGKNKENETGEIIVIKDKSQRPKRVKGILIDTSVKGRTTIEFSNRKFIDPFFGVLKKEWNELHWIKNHPRSRISTHIELDNSEIKRLKDLIEETINYN